MFSFQVIKVSCLAASGFMLLFWGFSLLIGFQTDAAKTNRRPGVVVGASEASSEVPAGVRPVDICEMLPALIS